MNFADEPFKPLTPQVFFILLALKRCELHGYAIKSQIEYDSEGRIRLSDGTLYPALKRLLKAGFIEELTRKNDKRIYKLTRTGEANLRSETRALKAAVGMAEHRFLAQQYGVAEQFYEV